MSSDESDEVLMERVKRGDRRAYEALYTRWSPRLFHFLTRRSGSRQAAEDAHQEAWRRVYTSRHSFQSGKSFPPWLFTIAAHAGQDSQRPEPQLFTLEEQPADGLELRDQLVKALHALSPLDRRILLLWVEGFGAPEIGPMVDLSPGNVRVRLHRARTRLQELLEAEDA